VSNAATSNYQALQLQFQRRLSRGLQALFNYTWSHAIDEISDETTQGRLARGNSNFDVRHNFSGAVSYDLARRKGHSVLDEVVRGWGIDGIIHVQSALPVDLTTSGSFVLPDGSLLSRRPNLIQGVPLYIDDPSVPGGRRFNSAAFKVAPAGTQGNFGRNVMRGLPLSQVDLALRRRIGLTENVYLQVRAEAFNIFNHPNFGGFGTSVNSPSTFGVATQMLGRSLGGLSPLYQIGGPRSLQFSLRLGF